VNRIQCAHLELFSGSRKPAASSRPPPQMEAEHGRIDPQLDAVDWVLAASDAVSFIQSVQTLGESLSYHKRHGENEALPLVETFLGSEGWAAFGRAITRPKACGPARERLNRELEAENAFPDPQPAGWKVPSERLRQRTQQVRARRSADDTGTRPLQGQA